MIRKVKDLILNLIGIKIVRFKRRLEEGGVALQFCRLRDLPTFRLLISSKVFQDSASVPCQASCSLFSFLKWVMTTFQVIYLIEVDKHPRHRVVGFVGLYNMELGRSLRVSLTVFNPEDRSRGYGEKALRVLLDLLQENGAAEVVYAEILKSNVPSLRLCRKLGFEVKRQDPDRLLLEKEQKRKSEKG